MKEMEVSRIERAARLRQYLDRSQALHEHMLTHIYAAHFPKPEQAQQLVFAEVEALELFVEELVGMPACDETPANEPASGNLGIIRQFAAALLAKLLQRTAQIVFRDEFAEGEVVDEFRCGEFGHRSH